MSYRTPTPKCKSVFIGTGVNKLRAAIEFDWIVLEAQCKDYILHAKGINIEVIFQQELLKKKKPNDKKSLQLQLDKVISKEDHNAIFAAVQEKLNSLYPDYVLYKVCKLLFTAAGS